MLKPLLTPAVAVLLAAVAAQAQDAPPARPTPAATPRPTPAVLETAALSLEVSPRPYRYKVTERATGKVLVQHYGTEVRFGDISPETRNLASIEKTAAGDLEAQLGFSNTSKRAKIQVSGLMSPK